MPCCAAGSGRPVAIYDPDGIIAAFDAFYPLTDVDVAGLYVQNVEHLDRSFGDHKAQPVTELKRARPRPCSSPASMRPRPRAIGHMIPHGAMRFGFEA